MRFQSSHLTYEELNRRANQLARYLVDTGVKQGDPVAVCLQPSLETGVC
ncbi:amino acid adenylation domain-containing protein [Haemophilus parainfluenzae]|nr:amino acid adenylation domain-containing protein [Haemophilus parainfluenzae]